MPRKPLHQYTEFAGKLNLNIGCAHNLIDSPGRWVNVDAYSPAADVQGYFGNGLINALRVGLNMKRIEGKVDFILASHVVEHLKWDAVFRAVDEAWMLLRPGGVFIAITPHGRSEDAWENPHHHSYFSENTWSYFLPQLYEAKDTAGLGAEENKKDYIHPWSLNVALVPYDEYKALATDDFEGFQKRTKTMVNIWREVHAILVKPKE